ncbi:hypothetical protein D8I24_3190 (plasmid) [Cupriavidus necator H850]|nr:hypothetical protein D8I24_3190 [Cupriavidus necator H850]
MRNASRTATRQILDGRLARHHGRHGPGAIRPAAGQGKRPPASVSRTLRAANA